MTDLLHRLPVSPPKGANGTRLAIAYLPTRRDARPSYLDERRRRLAEYAARRGVPFVDLTPALRALPADSLELAFISRIESGVAPGVIGHYTPAGGTWVAHQLALSFAAIPSLRGLFAAPRQTGPQRDTQDAAPIPAARPVAHAHKKL